MLVKNSLQLILPPLIIAVLSLSFFFYTKILVILVISLLFTLLTVFFIIFFRDPKRLIGKGVVAPADGKIIELEKAEKTKISIFMRLWDVHVNRVPIDCKIKKIIPTHGKYYPAYSNKAVENEKVEFELETEIGIVKLIQVAGAFARRIGCWVGEKEFLKKGQRFGMIRFGSRVELCLPSERLELKVKLGDKVIAGKSTLGLMK